MKYSIILSNLGACSDRYMPQGYTDGYSLQELYMRLEKLRNLSAVELVGTWHVTEGNMDFLQQQTISGLPVAAIIPDHFGSRRWGKGAFTAPDKAIRRQAVEETLAMARCARALGCNTISIWNGQDGYDYPLQADYIAARHWLRDGIAEVANEAPDMRIALEYKPREPRNRCFLPNVHSVLALAGDIGLGNVGVTIDVGHSFEAMENVSEAICLAMDCGRLFHLHTNDNNRTWDDDMVTGSVHTIEFIEMFYWLQRLGYDGYLSIDQYPYREDSLVAAQQSLDWMAAFDRAAARIDHAALADILLRQDALASTALIRELLFGK
jgi:xylose isomerase